MQSFFHIIRSISKSVVVYKPVHSTMTSFDPKVELKMNGNRMVPEPTVPSCVDDLFSVDMCIMGWWGVPKRRYTGDVVKTTMVVQSLFCANRS